jgi:hypothetical protein
MISSIRACIIRHNQYSSTTLVMPAWQGCGDVHPTNMSQLYDFVMLGGWQAGATLLLLHLRTRHNLGDSYC